MKSEVVKLKFNEENRNETQRKGIESINTIQQNLQSEIARVNDERVREEKENIDKMKKIWSEHEKDVQSHIQLICNNHVIKYRFTFSLIQEISLIIALKLWTSWIILMRKVRSDDYNFPNMMKIKRKFKKSKNR